MAIAAFSPIVEPTGPLASLALATIVDCLIRHGHKRTGTHVQLGARFRHLGSSTLAIRNHASKTLLNELNDVAEELDMRIFWTREFLARRIDRCYLIAAGARRPDKRTLHLELARYYRRILSAIAEGPAIGLVEARS